jgi:hypothetical protein
VSAPQFTSADEKALNADLRELGCPYAPGDPRVRPWLDGYKVGNSRAYEASMALAEQVFGKVVSQ